MSDALRDVGKSLEYKLEEDLEEDLDEDLGTGFESFSMSDVLLVC